MKNKLAMLTLATMLGCVMSSSAATMLVQNVSDGPGDMLWALNNNSLMSSGSIVMGYFAANVTPAQINTIPGLVANLGSFTAITSVTPGAVGPTLGVGAAGYAEGPDVAGVTVPGGAIVVGSPLLGRVVYEIATSAANLSAATTADQFALLSFGAFLGDQPIEQSFNGNPKGIVPIISDGNGTFVGDATFGGGAGTYSTLKLAVIPEPSAALLGAIGALGLLRRRRN